MRPEALKIGTVLLVLVNFVASEAFGSSSKLLSQKQKDEVMALHLLNSNPEGAYRAAAIAQAVRYAKNRSSGIYNPAEISRAEALSYMNPLSPSAYKSIFVPRDNHLKSLDQTLSETANRVYYETGIQLADGKLTRSTLDYIGNVSVAVAPVIVGPAGGAAIAVGKYTFDYLYDVSDPLGGGGRGLPQRALADELVYAQNEIRNNTEVGKVLKDYYMSLLGDDPLKNSDEKAPVKRALSTMASLKNLDSTDRLIERVEELGGTVKTSLADTTAALKEIKKDIEEVKKGQARRAMRQAPDPERERKLKVAYRLQNARGGLLMTGYLLELAGDRKGAQIAYSVADMADKVSTLISSAEKMAPMMLAAGYVGVAVAAVSLMKSTSGPDPYEAIFGMLQQISKQLEEIREEMLTGFAQLGSQMNNLLEANLDLTDAVKRDTEVLRRRLNEIQTKLEDAQRQLSEQIAVVARIQMRSEDRKCIRFSGGTLLEPKDFIDCRDLYVDRATNIAKEEISNSDSRAGMFPFASHYQKIQAELGIDDGIKIANPAVWYDSVGKILLLIQAFPKYLRTFDLRRDWFEPKSYEFDSMIKTGEEIRNFILSLAFIENNGNHKFERKNLEALLKKLEIAYGEADSSISQDLARTGLNSSIDITQPSAKQSGLSYSHQFLVKGGVSYCDQSLVGEKPRVAFVNPKVVSYAFRGGRHGQVIFRRPGIDNPGYYTIKDLTEDLNADFAGTPADTFRPDHSILPVIAPSVRLVEMLWPGSRIFVCLAGVKIHNLEINLSTGTNADVELNYLVLAPVNGKLEVVQKLSGTRHVSFAYFNYGYIQTRRVAHFLSNVVSQLGGKYHEFIKSTPVADKLNELTAVVDQYLKEKRINFRNSISDTGHSARIEEARRHLIMAASIGLNTSHVVVDEFVRRVQELTTMEKLLDEIVLEGKGRVEANNGIRENLEELRKLLTEMEKLPVAEILPNTTPLEAKINQLKVAKDQRELLTMRNLY